MSLAPRFVVLLVGGVLYVETKMQFICRRLPTFVDAVAPMSKVKRVAGVA